MATPETLPTQVFEPISEAYPTLSDEVDPLEIAAQALSKLKEHGLSGYIEPLEVEVQSQMPDIVTHPAIAGEKPTRQRQSRSTVANLDEFRHAKKQKHRTKRLDTAEQLRLLDRAKQGDDSALEEIWLDAQNTASYVADMPHGGRMKEDKMQTCLEVVPGAVKRYDPSKGASFKTCLIRRMIGALQDEDRAYGRANGLGRGDYKRLQDALKSDDPQAALHELTKPSRTSTGGIRPGFLMAPHLVQGSDIVTAQASLEQLMYGGDEIDGVVHSAEPVASQNVFEEAASSIEVQRLRQVLKVLPDRERTVLTFYNGLFDNPTMTLREIGETMGITESRVSQIHTRAMEHLAKIWGEETESHDFKPHRLRKIETQPRTVSYSRFMERIYNELDRVKNSVLYEEEVETVLRHISDWKVRQVDVSGAEYWLLQRALPDSAVVEDVELYNDETERRKVGRRGNAISILVEEVHGSDLRLAINLEKEIRRLGGGYNSEFAAQFSRRELEVISNLFETNGQLSLKLDIDESTVRTHIHKAMQRLGVSSVADLAVLTAREGLISLDNVPSERTQVLSGQESRLLRDCYNLTYEQGAEFLGISVSTYRTHWHNIFAKTGSFSQVQAVLMAMKDGLISRSVESAKAMAV